MKISYSECYDLIHEVLELNKPEKEPEPRENNVIIADITQSLSDLDNKELIIINAITNKMKRQQAAARTY